MKEIERLILNSKDEKYYRHVIKRFNSEELNDFEKLALRLEEAGAKNPLSWAFSEITEGIPQFARFLILKNLFDIIKSSKENLSLAADFDEEIENKFLDIQKLVGEEKISDFLETFSKAIIYNVVNLLDEGNFNSDRDEMNWVLIKTNNDVSLTEKIISGLHEDFLDFEDEIRSHH